MIEPTDEMLIAWRSAMKVAAAEAVKAGAPLARSQEIARAGLAAVLAIVERDYIVQPQRCPDLGTRFQCMRQAGHDGAHSGTLGEIEVSWP